MPPSSVNYYLIWSRFLPDREESLISIDCCCHSVYVQRVGENTKIALRNTRVVLYHN